MRKHLKEVIVVEGKSDTNVLQGILSCDTIETNGSAVSKETLNKIELAQSRRGVIIFTDPDFPGEKIRKTIDQAIPGCKHAFLAKSAAIDHRKKKVGVEHASREDILEALENVKASYGIVSQTEITREDLLTAGLIAGNRAKMRREKLGEILSIGYTNGKQLLKRLQQFQISKEEFIEALNQVIEENDYE
ncbi:MULTISPECIES: ribonuclease M5 [Bacillaceae]|uniref:Ribonuclease M5 n=1 Tax=Evansella alkalicola TaxID=745819 RepID=A0ABS6JTU2_9BACI|nr:MULTISPECIES: ribonuclease M5 [Bacillaceae]MBU9721984.1 ribonuclease M5 [Bacillus alkalicola]